MAGCLEDGFRRIALSNDDQESLYSQRRRDGRQQRPRYWLLAPTGPAGNQIYKGVHGLVCRK